MLIQNTIMTGLFHMIGAGVVWRHADPPANLHKRQRCGGSLDLLFLEVLLNQVASMAAALRSPPQASITTVTSAPIGQQRDDVCWRNVAKILPSLLRAMWHVTGVVSPYLPHLN
jgi:hypothetical protein